MKQRYLFNKYKKEFIEYFNSKNIDSTIKNIFLKSFEEYIKKNKDSFIIFWEIIKKYNSLPPHLIIKKINKIYSTNNIIKFISDWKYSYIGSGEIFLNLLFKDGYSGGRKYPDILFKNSNKRIEVKLYKRCFRLTENTYFSTDLGIIIQSLVQGGFLSNIINIKNDELKEGLKYFSEAFLNNEEIIEYNNKMWKLESKLKNKIILKSVSNDFQKILRYNIVRNSIKNWVERGVLSSELIKIIKTKKITKDKINNYISNLIGTNNIAPIPLKQYFKLHNLKYIIIYEPENKNYPYQIIKYNDLKNFTIDRITQSKVSYKKV